MQHLPLKLISCGAMSLGWGLWLYGLSWVWAYITTINQALRHELLIGLSVVSFWGVVVGLVCLACVRLLGNDLSDNLRTGLIWVLPAHIISGAVLDPLVRILKGVNFSFA